MENKSDGDEREELNRIVLLLDTTSDRPLTARLNTTMFAWLMLAVQSMNEKHVFPDGLETERKRLMGLLDRIRSLVEGHEVDSVAELHYHEGDTEAAMLHTMNQFERAQRQPPDGE